MAWVGTGAVWTLSGGILKGSPLGQSSRGPMMSHGDSALRFVQISDSHIGFDKPANTDVTATLRAAIATSVCMKTCGGTAVARDRRLLGCIMHP